MIMSKHTLMTSQGSDTLTISTVGIFFFMDCDYDH